MADNESGKSTLSEVRTSSGMFLPKDKVRSMNLSEFLVTEFIYTIKSSLS